MKSLTTALLLLAATPVFAVNQYVGKFTGDGSGLTNVLAGGATNALVNGPGGNRDASLVTNVPASSIASGTITPPVTANTLTANSLSIGVPAGVGVGALFVLTNAGTGMGTWSGVVPAASLPPNVATNLNYQSYITFSTFDPGTIGDETHVFLFQGTTPTNFFITTSTNLADAVYVDPNGNLTRDPSIIKWVDNYGRASYLLAYNAITNALAPSPGVGVATSSDAAHWTFYGYVLLGGSHYSKWSPKWAINGTNGIELSVAMGPAGNNSPPTNSFIMDIAPNNFTNFSNLRWTDTKPIDPFEVEPSSGQYLFYNGMWFYFSSDAVEYTNSQLTQEGWTLINGNLNQNIAGAGDWVVNFRGVWYWFFTDSQFIVIESPDLITWKDLSGVPAFTSPFSAGTAVNSIMHEEGTAIVENYATPPPGAYANAVTNGQQGLALGITRLSNGSGLTNLAISGLNFSGTNVVVTNNVALKVPAFTAGGVTYYLLLFTNGP